MFGITEFWKSSRRFGLLGHGRGIGGMSARGDAVVTGRTVCLGRPARTFRQTRPGAGLPTGGCPAAGRRPAGEDARRGGEGTVSSDIGCSRQHGAAVPGGRPFGPASGNARDGGGPDTRRRPARAAHRGRATGEGRRPAIRGRDRRTAVDRPRAACRPRSVRDGPLSRRGSGAASGEAAPEGTAGRGAGRRARPRPARRRSRHAAPVRRRAASRAARSRPASPPD